MAKRSESKKTAPAKSAEYKKFVLATKIEGAGEGERKWHYHGFLNLKTDLTGGVGTLLNIEDSDGDLNDELNPVSIFPWEPKAKTSGSGKRQKKDSEADEDDEDVLF